MIESLVSVVGQRGVDAAAFLLAFALTALTDSLFHNKLPHDHGREFAVNGGLSKGKARGSGLIFVLCIALVSLAFLPFRVEYVIYTVLLIASMLSGYFDDAAEKAWNEYKKGIIDFVIAVVAGVTYLNFNGCGVQFLQWSFTLPYAVYLLLIVILIWASINVVNCTDGVDGLSASLAVVTIGTYLIAYHEELADYSTAGVVFMGALLAYLWSSLRLPAGGYRVHRGRQPWHHQDQPEAFPAHLHPQEHPHPAARPCAQEQGLERRAGRGPLAHPAVRGIGSAAARGARLINHHKNKSSA